MDHMVIHLAIHVPSEALQDAAKEDAQALQGSVQHAEHRAYEVTVLRNDPCLPPSQISSKTTAIQVSISQGPVQVE
eukprot:332307-Amphidinium_carterae.1